MELITLLNCITTMSSTYPSFNFIINLFFYLLMPFKITEISTHLMLFLLQARFGSLCSILRLKLIILPFSWAFQVTVISTFISRTKMEICLGAFFIHAHHHHCITNTLHQRNRLLRKYVALSCVIV